MDNEKSDRQKATAIMSLGFLVAAVCFILIDAATTICTKGPFVTAFIEMTD
jgi:hypothetical protein